MILETGGIVVATMVRQRRNTTGFGERLARLRKSRHMTQAELATAVGVTQGLISFYEKGSTEPSTAVMVAIARALRVSADELLGLRVSRNGDHEKEDLRLMRRLRQVKKLAPKERKSVLQLIDALVTQKETRHRAQG